MPTACCRYAVLWISLQTTRLISQGALRSRLSDSWNSEVLFGTKGRLRAVLKGKEKCGAAGTELHVYPLRDTAAGEATLLQNWEVTSSSPFLSWFPLAYRWSASKERAAASFDGPLQLQALESSRGRGVLMVLWSYFGFPSHTVGYAVVQLVETLR